MLTSAPKSSKDAVLVLVVVLLQLAAQTVMAQGASCAAPYELGTVTTSVRNTVVGDTTSALNLMFNAVCAPARGPEVVIRFIIPSQTSVTASFRVSGSFDTVLVLALNGCSYANAVGCNDDATSGQGSSDTSGSSLSGTLVPGTYYLIIDGYGPTSFGAFSLTYEFQISGGTTPRPPPPPPPVTVATTRSPPFATPAPPTARPTPAPIEPSPPSDRSSSGEPPSSSADAPSTASAGGTKSKSKRVGVVVGASIGGVALFVAIAALLCCCCRPQRRPANQPTDNDDGTALPKPALPTAEPYGAPSDVTPTPFGGPILVTKTTAPQPTPPFGGYWIGDSSYSHATPPLPLPLGEIEAGSVSVVERTSATTPAYPYLPPTEVSITTPTTSTTTTITTNACGDALPGFSRPLYPARQREQQGCV